MLRRMKAFGWRLGLTAPAAVAQLEKRLRRLEDKLEGFAERSRQDGLVLRRLVGLVEQRHDTLSAEEPSALSRPAGFGAEPDSFEITACPLCGTAHGTLVCEYNRFFLADAPPDESAKIYNYSLCHGCGIVYAARRPVGTRYRYLLEHFHESLGRRGTPSPLLNPLPLSDAARADLLARVSNGVLVSEHGEKRQWLPAALRDRLAVAPHLDLLGSLLNLRAPRVLEIRSRTGAILDGLRRLYGAEVYALPVFESHQAVISGLYGIPAVGLVDFDNFAIPYDGTFDLIIANHMLTHVLHPQAFLEQLIERLAPGGHLYFYNEMDEGEIREVGQSLFQIMNPFHMQLYTSDSLARALSSRGLQAEFITHLDPVHIVCLARKADVSAVTMTDKERRERLSAWQLARDLAILKAPDAVRSRFEHEVYQATERAVVAGAAVFDDKGRLHFSRKSSRVSAELLQ